MKEKRPLTNVWLARNNLRISFICLAYAVLGIVNASGYWQTFWKMDYAVQWMGYIISLVLLIAGIIFAFVLLVRMSLEMKDRTELGTILFHYVGILLEFIFLFLTLSNITQMSAILNEGSLSYSGGMGKSVALTVIAVLNLIMDGFFLVRAKKQGIENGGKLSPSQFFKQKAEPRDISVAKEKTPVGGVAFCPNCGSPVNGEDRFCPNCGQELPKEVK